MPRHTSRIDATEIMPPGSTLVLYSDGLIERRGESLDVGLARLAASASRHIASDPELFGDELIEALLGGRDQTDDVAMLCLRRPHDEGAPLSLRLPAAPSELARLRRAMRLWMADAGVPGAIADDVVLASGEAAANVIEHAYAPDAAGTMEVRMTMGGGRLVASVRDFGRWRAHGSTEGRGRGIRLIGALMDQVDLHSSEDGTEVTMVKAIEDRPVEAFTR
jgi:anti-sigma regulatory factor (Ser/Thr protein kinase)